MACPVRKLTVRVPRGPSSERMQGNDELTLALGPNPEAEAVNAMMDLAMATVLLVGSCPEDPLGRQIAAALDRKFSSLGLLPRAPASAS
eukprot:6191540-Pyramimonas_sp.AAC.1